MRVCVCVSHTVRISVTEVACALLRMSSCVSGCLSAGAKPTHTTDRKLQLHLGQHSPVLPPDSAPTALWESNPQKTFLTEAFLSLVFQLFTKFSL